MSYPKNITDGNFLEATEEELKIAIITIDGLGKKVQKEALDELLRRKYNDGLVDGRQTEES